MFNDLPLLANGAIFVAAAVVVWLAGTRLARYADRIEAQTGLGEGLLGFILLGVATSTPEIAVGVTAALAGTPELSVNDVLGSASINLVILALADAVYGRGALTSTPATPQVMLQGVLGMLILGLVIGPTVTGDRLLFGIGAWSWLIGAAFAGAIWFIAHSSKLRSWVPAGDQEPSNDRARDSSEHRHTLRQLLTRTAGAVVVILAAGFVLAQTGEALAEQTGLGASFVGAMLIGLATSMPEVSTALAAIRLKRYEMAIAGIFSTNVFNVLIIVLIDAVYAGPPVLVEAGRFAAFAALLAMLLTGFFMIGMIERRDRTVWRMGVDSMAVLLCFGAGVFVLYQLR